MKWICTFVATVGLAGTFCLLFATPASSVPAQPGEEGTPLPASEAAASFRLPEGFRVQVFAAEPEVQNPIAMTWDGRGRLWIAENFTYAERELRFDLGRHDRIVILHDSDGDGRADQRTIFTDDLQNLASLEIGRGGVFVLCPPRLLFLPDADGNDSPDGPAEVLLDGFHVSSENYHTFANGLRWGPDGWLYGRCGASSIGHVGLPGTPAAERIPLHGGLWRFHPERKLFEVLAHGTTNPWGHDWNEYGEPFFVNTVNGHLWHAFAGAHFRRPHSQDPNPRVYEPLDMHADHWHWDTGKNWTDSRSGAGEHDRLGGGHAHSGCMIYLADNWPREYRGRLMTLNFHGRRINVERLERTGSGYLARHEPDIFHSADTWFRGIDLSYGPDGSVYVLDWSDTGECHEHTGVHRESGRIYKITYHHAAPSLTGDLARFDNHQLVELHEHANEWFARQSRRILIDRARAGSDVGAACHELRARFDAEKDIPRKLRYLWTLFCLGGTDRGFLRSLLAHENEHVRVWGIRLLTDIWPLDTILSTCPRERERVDRDELHQFVRLAETDESGLVRLVLASTLQRLAPRDRIELARALAARGEDAQDANLPGLLWMGMIPVAEIDPAALVQVAASAQMPLVRTFIARRLGEDVESHAAPLNALLIAAAQGSRDFQADVLAGLTEALAGWRKAPAPAAWEEFQKATAAIDDPVVQSRLRDLSILFGDGRALDEVRKIALDGNAELSLRRAALETLIRSRPDDLRPVCESLLTVRFLNTTAVRGLAMFDDPEIGEKLARSYRNFHPSERPAVIETLVSRPAFALALLQQIAEGRISKADLTPFQARQIRSLGDETVSRLLRDVWGEIRETDEAKREHIARLKERLTSERLASADRSQGRLIFEKACAACHRLYGHGGTIGPDLTGSGRHDLEYLLENLVDPSATVGAEFRVSIVVLTDGRTINGMIAAETERTVTLQTEKNQITIPRDEIEELVPSNLSVMPEGLLQSLTEEQARDLVAYLMHPVQVPRPETPAAIGSE